MTPLRLHKLLYFCQGWYLAWYDRPLFADEVEAWEHGPVVPVVYAHSWGRGSGPIGDLGDPCDLSAVDQKAIEQVWRGYRKYSAWGLRDMTHNESPWKNHYDANSDGRCKNVIPGDELARFFKDEYQRITGEPVDDDADYSIASARVLTIDQLTKEVDW
ncbi:Panacea domain-containing protein [Fimbriiglobus ruber]|uniref:Panacea domain-containing protein n=1 Tax=Fimbriiglobus ruber TaxID=1908690 RepID=UPI00137ABCAC|nr:type II toxin-antitoxin system antitoxin SocA domain-containing protein [Fimbriiglobus ruber]